MPESDPAEESRLLAAVAAGDRDAFRQFYTRYSAPLFSLAIRFVGDTGTAEEALQDTFVKIWQHAGDFDDRKSQPFTWAVTILRRTSIDHLRKRGRRPQFTVLPDDTDSPAALSTSETTRQTTEARETSERVQSALAALASPQRDALELALYSTLTHTEIAARLSQPVGSVKTWIRRGLLELRGNLKEIVP